MAKRKDITDPGTVFRMFCGQYRTLTPTVWIPQTLAQRIDAFIEDVASARRLTPFSKAELSTFGRFPGSIRCSIHFIEYLKQLSHEMKRQTQFTVSPRRACELLFNINTDRNYEIEFMTVMNFDGDDYLVSCGIRDHLRLCLLLGTAREFDDWTLST